jgi:hypothetical protein
MLGQTGLLYRQGHVLVVGAGAEVTVAVVAVAVVTAERSWRAQSSLLP